MPNIFINVREALSKNFADCSISNLWTIREIERYDDGNFFIKPGVKKFDDPRDGWKVILSAFPGLLGAVAGFSAPALLVAPWIASATLAASLLPVLPYAGLALLGVGAVQVYNKKRPENQYDPKAGILFGIFSPGYLGFKAAFMPTYAAITGLEWAVKGVVGVGEGIATTLGGASLKSEQPTAQVAGTPMAREDISQGITALGSKSCASTFNNQASRNSLDRNASETLGCHTPSEKAQGRLSESYKR